MERLVTVAKLPVKYRWICEGSETEIATCLMPVQHPKNIKLPLGCGEEHDSERVILVVLREK